LGLVGFGIMSYNFFLFGLVVRFYELVVGVVGCMGGDGVSFGGFFGFFGGLWVGFCFLFIDSLGVLELGRGWGVWFGFFLGF